ncbi:MAG: 1-acyl-sn-glycerol-3-phosphate acyltransferase, partial [Anaerolineales bacterium]|nr:1-acyl-sn-glycerol-3-phosphate acyltransferase [Anaerolineales bacterium]
AAWAVNGTLKRLLRILCRVDDAQLKHVPHQGPLILVTNHINFLEVPLVYTHLQPRPVTGWAKAETWDRPAMAFLFNLWGGIPIRRGEADLTALRRGLKALEAGHILAIAPEGTRSGHGRLQAGQPGIVTLALHSGAPILPMVYYGSEQFHENIRRLKRTEFHIAVGRPFTVVLPEGVRATNAIRKEITDEIMFQLAGLLPPDYRGVYADLSQATPKYLRAIDWPGYGGRVDSEMVDGG